MTITVDIATRGAKAFAIGCTKSHDDHQAALTHLSALVYLSLPPPFVLNIHIDPPLLPFQHPRKSINHRSHSATHSRPQRPRSSSPGGIPAGPIPRDPARAGCGTGLENRLLRIESRGQRVTMSRSRNRCPWASPPSYHATDNSNCCLGGRSARYGPSVERCHLQH